jgi:hypothetical protein
VSKPGPGHDGFDEEELIRSEFESIVSGLSLDESSPTTYLEELDLIDETQKFKAPNPPRLTLKQSFLQAKKAIIKWSRRGYHEDDGVEL